MAITNSDSHILVFCVLLLLLLFTTDVHYVDNYLVVLKDSDDYRRIEFVELELS